jgi:3-dehydroquinate synthase/shikimate kinase/3-dehydroquinate synthase
VIVLVGFMGAGKTTVGRLAAEKLDLPFADADTLIQARAQMTVPEIFEARGEEGFRELERAVVADLLDGPEAVVALGGGAVLDERTRKDLAWANVVHVDVSLPTALERARDGSERPMLSQRDPESLYEERVPLYREVADFTVSTDHRSPEEVAFEVAQIITGPRRVRVTTPGRSYDVVIGPGASAAAGAAAAQDTDKAFLVTEDDLLDLSTGVVEELERAGLQVIALVVPAGEEAKSLATAERLYARLAEAPAHRADMVVAFGGGAVTDVAGFVASTFVRGMRLVNVPTTLLGQVDAAIGGKNAVNLPHAKNQVGTIYQPHLVCCDVGLLESLPEVELRSGLAEVVKYGLISDPSLLDFLTSRAGRILERDPATLSELVARCVRIKAAIVSRDELDHSERARLNYGHTFAHAIESCLGFGAIRHGEAVALGMMAAAHLARALGLVDDEVVATHRRALEAAGLPTRADLDLAALEEAWLRDKKYARGVRFVLLRGLGRAEWGFEAPRAALREAIERMSE